ncbi:MAG TPA: cytochrome c oxidase subunit 3 [Dehalococcoidia bacterium]|jgi:cytochrome c oxidase subunit 3|nr:cytochrome c oxidase subunit 3 [Dehalococcoidia bacterium]
MAAQAVASAAHEDPRRSLQIKRMGLWLFFISDGLLFALLATSRFYLVGTHTPDELSQVLGLGITSILLLSSLTAFRAETAIAHGNVAHAKLMLLATIGLGVIFAGGVAIEWSIAEFTPSEGFGTAFFSMTGMHVTHVVSGIVILGMAYLLLRRGRFTADNHWGLAAVVLYWHFVDVVWVFFYPTLYLIN